MRPSLKAAVVINDSGVTNGETATGNIDTLGYDWLKLDVMMTTSDDTTNNPSVLKLTESDDTVVSNFAAITKFTGDGAGGFTIPNAVTAGNWIASFNVDLRGRKRYLKLSVTPITTQGVHAIANLGLGDEAPVSAADDVKVIVEG